MPLDFYSRDRCVGLGGCVADEIVGAIVSECDEYCIAVNLHFEPCAAESKCEGAGIVVEFDAKDFRALREFRESASVLEFSLLDRDKKIADAFDFAEQVRRDDDRDAELASRPLY